VLGADGQLLADVAALAEVDGARLVEVALVREGLGVQDLGLALGDAVKVAAEGVGGFGDLGVVVVGGFGGGRGRR
jgi:hypothetical protein